MPAFGTHFLIIDKLVEHLEKSTDSKFVKLAEIIKANLEYAYLGSAGPDLFYAKDILDYLEPAVTALRAALGEFYLEKFNDALDEANKALRDCGDSMIPGSATVCEAGRIVIEQLEAMTGSAEQMGETVLFYTVDVILSIIDIVKGSFVENMLDFKSSGGMRRGGEEDKDGGSRGSLLHRQISGNFLKQFLIRVWGKDTLVEEDLEDNDNGSALAYLTGFITHIAGDVMGHSYVNQVVGGPYRHHAWRHIFCERVLDKHLWGQIKKGEDISSVNLANLVPFDIRSTLAPLIADAYNSIVELRQSKEVKYTKFDASCDPKLEEKEEDSRPIGDFITEDDIQGKLVSYRALLSISSWTFNLEMPQPPDILWLDEAVEKAWEKIEKMGDTLLPDDIDSVCDLIKALLAAIVLIVYTVITLVDEILASIESMAAGGILYTFYLILLGMWYVEHCIRELLVIFCVAYPDDLTMQEEMCTQFLSGIYDDLYPRQRNVEKHGDVVKTLINIQRETLDHIKASGFDCPDGFEEAFNELYKKYEGAEFNPEFLDKNPFVYPSTPSEEPKTFSGPYTAREPFSFIADGPVIRGVNFSDLCKIQCPAEFEKLMEKIKKLTVYESGTSDSDEGIKLDAVSLSSKLIQCLFESEDPEDPCKFVDWNLDSDRGFADLFWMTPKGQYLCEGDPICDTLAKPIKNCENPENRDTG